jgi:hypothetical protein
MKKILTQLNTPLIYLLGASVALNFFLIIFANLGILPLKYLSDFIFYALVFLALAFYRPKWGFLLFVGTIALENINIAPIELGMMLRPYQFIGGLTVVAVLLRIILRNSEYKITKLSVPDIALLVFALAGFFSTLQATAHGIALKQSIIITSFVMLYFLTRIFIKNILILKEAVLFFISSGLITAVYSVWQNIRFSQGANAFESMPGRPNATFTEPDWLGIFAVLFLASLLTIMYYLKNKIEENENLPAKVLLFIALILNFILLIITVARSAWLGAFFVITVFLLLLWTNLQANFRKWNWREVVVDKIFLATAFLLALASVFVFQLTTFQLFNRIQSTGTGAQKITIACPGGLDVIIPKTIQSADEYLKYNCRHINLDEIEEEGRMGNVVQEIYRPDPNINLRSQIYQKSIVEIKNNWFLGIGWGNINAILGTDERGSGLNSSNIFLEVWLGAGLIGLLAFIVFLVSLLLRGIQNFKQPTEQRKNLGLLIILSLVAIIIPNLFNAGIMLGVLWLFFGLISAVPKVKNLC